MKCSCCALNCTIPEGSTGVCRCYANVSDKIIDPGTVICEEKHCHSNDSEIPAGHHPYHVRARMIV